jgi:predicted Zn-dependent protease with MMP-like domain
MRERADSTLFDRAVAEALHMIPQRFRRVMQNIAIIIEDEPSPALLRELEVEPPATLFGLYQGTPLTERQWDHGNTQPDRILIFRRPHEQDAASEEDLAASVAETLIHEIGHYFGLSEEQIEAIEETWGRRRRPTLRRGSRGPS